MLSYIYNIVGSAMAPDNVYDQLANQTSAKKLPASMKPGKTAYDFVSSQSTFNYKLYSIIYYRNL